MVRVKICGITHEEDIALCVEEGADALGFVVEYPLPVPWTLMRERAAELMRSVPPFVSTVAVVGGNAQTILDICAATRPDAVQLHLDEPEEVVAAVAAGLADRGTRVIKAVRVRAAQRPSSVKALAPSQHWEDVAQRFLKAGAHAILLDSQTDDLPAGTGRTFNWQIARRVVAAVGPVILAGGLTPKNVGAAIAQVRPYAVDVISSLEDERRRKVRERVRAFVRMVREAASASE
jgi:phosphoribosylanthranilate isomerase